MKMRVSPSFGIDLGVEIGLGINRRKEGRELRRWEGGWAGRWMDCWVGRFINRFDEVNYRVTLEQGPRQRWDLNYHGTRIKYGVWRYG